MPTRLEAPEFEPFWGAAERLGLPVMIHPDFTYERYPALRAFPLRDTWLLAVPGHTGLKWAMAGFWMACLAAGGDWRRGALYMAAIALVAAVLKQLSPCSCPWDMPEFGGLAPQAGRCLPAAHPLTGFALFGLALALRDEHPRAALGILAAAWLIGLAAGALQVARGAHFVSHVLWTAWVAWAVTLALARASPRRRISRTGAGQA